MKTITTMGPENKSVSSNGSLAKPAYLQPCIFAISLTYILCTISASYGFTYTMPAANQFTNWCCIVGFVSVIVFYAKFSFSEKYHLLSSLIYIGLLVIIMVLYTSHWFVQPNFEKMPQDPDTSYMVGGMKPVYNSSTQKVDADDCIDKRKCSHPLHLVLQAVFIICVILSFLLSLYEPHRR